MLHLQTLTILAKNNFIMENTKKPIAPTLKKLEIGEKADYPIRRSTSVETTIGRVQRESTKKFSYRTIGQDEHSYIEVTRVS